MGAIGVCYYIALMKKRGFYHYDPISKSNYMHALELMGKLSLANKYFKSNITDIDSPVQSNGYDCGIYVVMYASKLADDK